MFHLVLFHPSPLNASKVLPVIIGEVCLQRRPVEEAGDAGDERRGPVVHTGGAVAALHSVLMRLMLRQHPAPPPRGTGRPAAAAGHGRSAANQQAERPATHKKNSGDREGQGTTSFLLLRRTRRRHAKKRQLIKSQKTRWSVSSGSEGNNLCNHGQNCLHSAEFNR